VTNAIVVVVIVVVVVVVVNDGRWENPYSAAYGHSTTSNSSTGDSSSNSIFDPSWDDVMGMEGGEQGLKGGGGSSTLALLRDKMMAITTLYHHYPSFFSPLLTITTTTSATPNDGDGNNDVISGNGDNGKSSMGRMMMRMCYEMLLRFQRNNFAM